MSTYLKNKEDVVQCVSEMLPSLKPGSASIMIITQGASEGYFVRTAIDGSSEDIVRLLGRFYYDRLTSI